MKEKLKNKIVIIIGFVLLVVIAVAIIFDWKIKIEFSTTLTAIAEFTTVVALIALTFQINMERKKNKEEKIDNTFFNLIDLLSNMKEKLISDEDVFKNIIMNIKYKKEAYIRNEQIKRQVEYIKEKKDWLFSIIKAEFPKENQHEYMSLPYYYYNEFEEKKELDTDDYRKILACFTDRSDYPYNGKEYKSQLVKMTGTNLNDYLLGLGKINETELNEDEITSICNKVFDYFYKDVGHFCRLFHRIVKFVNDNVKDSNSKSNYFGMLRAILSEDELLVIFYNSFYSDKGKGLSKQLVNQTKFFGDENDLPNDTNSELQHFSKNSLVFFEVDLKNMKSCIWKMKKIK